MNAPTAVTHASLRVFFLGTLKPVNRTDRRRGRLADTDVRWDTISGSVDDRTEEEMRPPDEPLLGELDTTEFLDDSAEEEGGGKYVRAKRQPKSR